MADGVDITQGSGTTVWTDDTANGHAQYVKLASGTDASVAVIPGDATRGLYVSPAYRIKRVQVTPTITATAYEDKDQLGGIMEITNASRVTGGGGILRGVTILCKANVAPTMVLKFYSQSVTVASDEAEASTSDADRAFQVGELIVAAGNWGTVESGTPANQFAQIPAPTGASTSIGLGLFYTCAATSLFCSAMITSATTFASTSDLVFSFVLEQD